MAIKLLCAGEVFLRVILEVTTATIVRVTTLSCCLSVFFVSKQYLPIILLCLASLHSDEQLIWALMVSSSDSKLAAISLLLLLTTHLIMLYFSKANFKCDVELMC